MKMMIMSAGLVLAAGWAGDARAQEAEAPTGDVAAVTVSYADLRIDDPDEARVLDRRLRMAARRVCDEPNRVITHYRVQHLCVKQAVADAWRQVGAHRSPQVADSRTVTLAAARSTQEP